MSNTSLRIAAEPLRSLGFASIGSSYVAVGSALLNPSVMYSLINMTNSDLYWSWDGVTNNGFLGANGGCLQYDFTTNKDWRQSGLFASKGLTTYVIVVSGETAPSTGSVYLTALYSANV